MGQIFRNMPIKRVEKAEEEEGSLLTVRKVFRAPIKNLLAIRP